ncbi:MAG: DUF3365 domain-containing protein [Betaproteobacteria bacterium]|nr:DUF3365 domain-containing protein [Betaproteobacteria bacterium]
MKTHRFVLAAALPFVLAACASTPSPDKKAAYAAEARTASGELIKRLVGELNDDIAKIGAHGAIGVCKDKAPVIAGEIAKKHGVGIKRVTFKNRNEKRSTPDAWEADALRALEKQLASGGDPAKLEHYDIVTGGDGKPYFRYTKGLVIGGLCMNCHGPKDSLSDAVKAKLATEYPNDQATGYQLHQFRGAISITRPL